MHHRLALVVGLPHDIRHRRSAPGRPDGGDRDGGFDVLRLPVRMTRTPAVNRSGRAFDHARCRGVDGAEHAHGDQVPAPADPARTYTNVRFRLGPTSKTPTSLDATFANNLTGAMTTVVQGNWNLPAQPAPTATPAPFDVDFNWTTPFLYTATSGDLLFDITLPGTIGKSSYFVDAEVTTGVDGAAIPFGTSGAFGTPESFALAANAPALRPGGSVSLTCGPFRSELRGQPGARVSDAGWGTVNLPLDLNVLGAANNWLYVSMDLQTGFATAPTAAGHESTFQASIPNTSTYNGLRVFAQAYYLDPSANNAGLVATHALALRLQDPTAGPESNMVGHFDSTSLKGNLVGGASRIVAPIVRFTGTF